MYKNKTHRSFAKFAFLNTVFFILFFYLNEKSYLEGNLLYISLLVFLVLQAGFYLFVFSRPLHKITRQVAALLAGKSYSKVNLHTKDEFGMLAYFFNDVTKNIKKISYYLKEGERMASELQIASDIQKSVLPKSIPMIPYLDAIAKTRPADEMGGDSFAIQQKGDDYYFYIGDVTGHGAPAGLVMMIVNTLFDVLLPVYNNTLDLAVNINRVLKPRVNSTMFMTTNFFKWIPATRNLTYTGAGHEHILIYRAAEGVCEAIPAGGIALAMAEDVSEILEEKQLSLSDQDVIVLYSDGITEAANMQGELYGLERLKTAVKNYGHLGESLQIFTQIAQNVNNFAGDAVQGDDMTLMVLRYVAAGYNPEQKESLTSTSWNVS